MSYISPSSNPDRLYAYEGVHGVHLSKGAGETYILPSSVFHRLLKLWYSRDTGTVLFKGAIVKELLIEDRFRIVLSYKEWSIDLWPVTWHYLVLYHFVSRRFNNLRYWRGSNVRFWKPRKKSCYPNNLKEIK
jgi:hypothetical protein